MNREKRSFISDVTSDGMIHLSKERIAAAGHAAMRNIAHSELCIAQLELDMAGCSGAEREDMEYYMEFLKTDVEITTEVLRNINRRSAEIREQCDRERRSELSLLYGALCTVIVVVSSLMPIVVTVSLAVILSLLWSVHYISNK